MKVQNKTIKSSILKKLFIKVCRIFDFEIIDQGNLHLPVIDKKSPRILSKIGDQSLVLPMGKIKITRKVKSLDIILRTCASVNMLSQSKKRIFKSTKDQYSLRTLISLINSINNNKKIFENIKLKLTMIDHNSEKKIINKFKKILKKHKPNGKIIGGYYPYNYEIDTLKILKKLETKKYHISLPKIKKNSVMPKF